MMYRSICRLNFWTIWDAAALPEWHILGTFLPQIQRMQCNLKAAEEKHLKHQLPSKMELMESGKSADDLLLFALFTTAGGPIVVLEYDVLGSIKSW